MDINSEMMEEIKHLECPTGEVADRVMSILEDYNPSGQYQIIEEEDDDFIEDHMKLYNVFSEDEEAPSFGVVVKEGLDDYVAEVVDVYELED
jgi:hypothetical protein